MIIGQNDQLFRAGGADRFAVSEGRRADGTPYVRVDGVKDFLIWQTFDCGQCFRFDPTEDGGFDGVALGRYVRFSQPSPDRLEITGSDVADFENIWKHYLALDDDYASIRAGIAESTADAAGRPGAPDPVMGEAMRCDSGIRILHQEPWETLCSFIVSQNNNIPRIKKIIAAMSEKYGEPLNAGGETYYAFPTAEALVDAGVGGLAELKTGFRAKYIYDAAERGRLSYRSAGVRTERERSLVSRDSGSRTAGASARHIIGISRVVRLLEIGVLSGGAHRELVHVQLSECHGSHRGELLDDSRVVRGDEVLKHP